MAQYELDVLDYWMILKKRKYLILLATLLVLGFTFTFTQFMKPTPLYEASARVKFDRSTTVAQQLLESITFATANDLTTQTEVIKGFPVMERVAQAFGNALGLGHQLGVSAHAHDELGADVRREKDDRVPEVDAPSLAVFHPALVEDLEEQFVDV